MKSFKPDRHLHHQTKRAFYGSDREQGGGKTLKVLRGLFAYFSHYFRRVCMSAGAIHCLVLDIKGGGPVNNL